MLSTINFEPVVYFRDFGHGYSMGVTYYNSPTSAWERPYIVYSGRPEYSEFVDSPVGFIFSENGMRFATLDEARAYVNSYWDSLEDECAEHWEYENSLHSF